LTRARQSGSHRGVFVIREAQFDALAAARREDFVRCMMDALRARFDVAAAMEAAELRELVVDGTAAAEGYGLYFFVGITSLLVFLYSVF
jgi:hypothetical protein